ncbi:MAG TPA: hypothetical protein VGL94_03725 [Ktedonobacteraceae bacterium]
MSLNVCPAATVAAPIEYVWELITSLALFWAVWGHICPFFSFSLPPFWLPSSL